jgi:nucleoside-diphosphate-sugar epimerase
LLQSRPSVLLRPVLFSSRFLSIEYHAAATKLLDLCIKHRIQCLVYVSTYNVVFNGQASQFYCSGCRPMAYCSLDDLLLPSSQTILAGTHQQPYIPDNLHTDEYSRYVSSILTIVLLASREKRKFCSVRSYCRTKCLAEQHVLESTRVTSLKACAIRPAAIYGEGEQRHFPRIINLINQGRLKCTTII